MLLLHSLLSKHVNVRNPGGAWPFLDRYQTGSFLTARPRADPRQPTIITVDQPLYRRRRSVPSFHPGSP